jgi:hypothetical protein
MPKFQKRKRRKQPQKCIFCGAPNVTKEHIWPRWTHYYMLPRQRKVRHGLIAKAYLDRTEYEVVKLRHQMRDWQVKCVCGGDHHTCNNGWMREKLENPAKLIMLPLIKGEAVRITPSAQTIIAGWAALKSMVAEYDQYGSVTVHHMQRKHLRLFQRPPDNGWGIWIGYFERKKSEGDWWSRPLLIIPDKQLQKLRTREATHSNSCATTQIIGKLFIHVIHCPMPGIIRRWRWPRQCRGSLFRIWPPSSYSIDWPGTPIIDGEAELIADAFANFALEVGRRQEGLSSSVRFSKVPLF